MTESTPLWQTRKAYSSTWKRFQNRCQWSACFHGEFSLWCGNRKAFCELPFALQSKQSQNDKKNVDVAPLVKISADAHGCFHPFNKLSHMGESG